MNRKREYNEHEDTSDHNPGAAFYLRSRFSAGKIVVGGSGSLNEEISDLAKAYMAKNSGDAIEVRPESMSTEGGIEGVRIGRLHIGLISRPLTQSEKGKLLYLPIARSMTGIVIHKSIAVDNLTEAQICDVFQRQAQILEGTRRQRRKNHRSHAQT